MSAPLYSNVIASLFTQVDLLTHSFTYNGYQALAAYLATPIALACTLYITLLGFGIGLGYISGTFEQFTKATIKIGLVYMFALNWGHFSQYVVALFETSATEIGAVLLKANPLQGSITGTDLNSALQQLLNHIIQMGQTSLGQATLRHPMPLIFGLVVWGFGGFIIFLCTIELLMAKIMLSILMCVAPLFIGFALLDNTKGFFDRWLGTLAGYALVLVFVSVATAFAMSLVSWSIGNSSDLSVQNSVGWIPLVLTAVLSVTAVIHVTAIAKAIGGACGTSGGAVMVSAFMGGAMGATGMGLRTALSPFRKFNQARSNRRDHKARAKERQQLGQTISDSINQSLKKGES